jgi:hypothetical protein
MIFLTFFLKKGDIMARLRNFVGRSRRFVSRFRPSFRLRFRSRRNRRRRAVNPLTRRYFGIPASILLLIAGLLFFTPLGKSIKEKLGL